MRAAFYAALGLAAYAVFLAATIPAAFVAGYVQGPLRGQAAIADAEGTLWHGRATVTRASLVDRVEWRFVPRRLLEGGFAFATHHAAAGLAGDFEVARTPGRWHVRDAKLEGDASALAEIFPLLATWRPSGRFAVSGPSVSFGDRPADAIEGELTAEWRGAATALSEVKPLGSYRAMWRAGRVTVTTSQGPLRITGEGTLGRPAPLDFRGEARADAESAKALEPLLDLLGPRRPDGARALELHLR